MFFVTNTLDLMVMIRIAFAKMMPSRKTSVFRQVDSLQLRSGCVIF